MPEKVDPIVGIELGGKERHLKYCFKAMVAFTKSTGKNLFDEKIIHQILYRTTPEDLLMMVWACLLHEDEALTFKQVEEWITLENQAECARKIIKTWAAAMPKGDKKEKAPLASNTPPG